MREDIDGVSLNRDLFQRVLGGASVVISCKEGNKVRFKDVKNATEFADLLRGE